MLSIIKEELEEIAARFADERRTEITASEDELDIEDLIADQQMVITITKSGYIKSLPLATYRQQRRGGVGVTGMDMKDGDYIEHLFVCSSHDFLLFFSNRGKVYRSKVYELPEASRTAKGRALVNILPLREGERVQSVLSTRDFHEAEFLVFATKRGRSRRPSSSPTTRRSRPTGSSPSTSATTTSSSRCAGSIRATRSSWSRATGWPCGSRSAACARWAAPSAGVRGMNITGADNEVLAMDVARDDQELLVVTENGFGKRTRSASTARPRAAAKGVQTIKFSERRGGLAAALVVRAAPGARLHLPGGHGPAHQRARDPRHGRAAQGVTLMNVREEDHVSAVALVVESDGATAAVVSDEALADGPLDLSADSGDTLPDGVVDEDVPEGVDGAAPTADLGSSDEAPEEDGEA